MRMTVELAASSICQSPPPLLPKAHNIHHPTHSSKKWRVYIKYTCLLSYEEDFKSSAVIYSAGVPGETVFPRIRSGNDFSCSGPQTVEDKLFNPIYTRLLCQRSKWMATVKSTFQKKGKMRSDTDDEKWHISYFILQES